MPTSSYDLTALGVLVHELNNKLPSYKASSKEEEQAVKRYLEKRISEIKTKS